MNTLQVLESWLMDNEGIPVDVRKAVEKEINVLTRKAIREMERKKSKNKNSSKMKNEEDRIKAYLEMAQQITKSRMGIK